MEEALVTLSRENSSDWGGTFGGLVKALASDLLQDGPAQVRVFLFDEPKPIEGLLVGREGWKLSVEAEGAVVEVDVEDVQEVHVG